MSERLTHKAPETESQNKKLRKEFSGLLSQRIKEVRKEKKLTQQELTEKAGLHLTYVGHLELGKYHPTVYVMWKVSKALGVTVNDLVDF